MPPTYFQDRTHMLLAGVTGARTDYGGKTALANWWATEWGRQAFDVVWFCNYKGDDGPAEAAETEVGSVQELATAMKQGARHICLTPRDHDWEAVSRRVADFSRELPSDMSKFVVHDEAPELDEDALLWWVRVAGNGATAKSLVISQAPGDLPMGVRRQTALCWVGPVTEDNRHVFRANNRGNHFDWIREHHDPYQWTVMTGPASEDRDTFDPVPERFA